MAWHAEVPLTSALARQLRSPAHCCWPKSQTSAQKAWMGPSSFPSRGHVYLFLESFPYCPGPRFAEVVIFGDDKFNLLNDQDDIHLSLLMSLMKTFSTGCDERRRGDFG